MPDLNQILLNQSTDLLNILAFACFVMALLGAGLTIRLIAVWDEGNRHMFITQSVAILTLFYMFVGAGLIHWIYVQRPKLIS